MIVHWHPQSTSPNQLNVGIIAVALALLHPLPGSATVRFSSLLHNWELQGADCFGWNQPGTDGTTCCMLLTSHWLLSQLGEFLCFSEVQGKGKWLGPLLVPDSSTAASGKLATTGTELGHADWGRCFQGDRPLWRPVCGIQCFSFQSTDFLWPKQFLFSSPTDLLVTR